MKDTGKKYLWKINEPLPLVNEHSLTKHKLVARYLQEYVSTMMSNPRIPNLDLTIVDGFAGGGKYTNELDSEIVDGSPFVILNAMKEAETFINHDRKKTKRNYRSISFY